MSIQLIFDNNENSQNYIRVWKSEIWIKMTEHYRVLTGRQKPKLKDCLYLTGSLTASHCLLSCTCSPPYFCHFDSYAKLHLQYNQIKNPKGTVTINLTENLAWKINVQYTLRTTNTLHLSLFVHMSINEPTGYKAFNKKYLFSSKIAKFL